MLDFDGLRNCTAETKQPAPFNNSGLHGLACRRAETKIQQTRHKVVNSIFINHFRDIAAAGNLSIKKEPNLAQEGFTLKPTYTKGWDLKCRGDFVVIENATGKRHIVDLTINSPVLASNISKTYTTIGAAASMGRERKEKAYGDKYVIPAGVNMVMLSIESTGRWDEAGMEWAKQVTKRALTEQPGIYSIKVRDLVERVACALVRGYTSQIAGFARHAATCPPVDQGGAGAGAAGGGGAQAPSQDDSDGREDGGDGAESDGSASGG